MIPASYLFKDVYRQTWLDPDIEAAIERQANIGKGRPIWTRLVSALAFWRARRNEVCPHGTLVHE